MVFDPDTCQVLDIPQTDRLSKACIYYLSVDSTSRSNIREIQTKNTKRLLCTAGLSVDHLRYSPEGKPYLCESADHSPHISISHTSRMQILGVSDAAIGVDVQKPISAQRMKAVVYRICSDDELRLIHAQNIQDLCYIWTAKEAAWKLIGTGAITSIKIIGINMGEHIMTCRWSGSRDHYPAICVRLGLLHGAYMAVAQWSDDI